MAPDRKPLSKRLRALTERGRPDQDEEQQSSPATPPPARGERDDAAADAPAWSVNEGADVSDVRGLQRDGDDEQPTGELGAVDDAPTGEIPLLDDDPSALDEPTPVRSWPETRAQTSARPGLWPERPTGAGDAPEPASTDAEPAREPLTSRGDDASSAEADQPTRQHAAVEPAPDPEPAPAEEPREPAATTDAAAAGGGVLGGLLGRLRSSDDTRQADGSERSAPSGERAAAAAADEQPSQTAAPERADDLPASDAPGSGPKLGRLLRRGRSAPTTGTPPEADVAPAAPPVHRPVPETVPVKPSFTERANLRRRAKVLRARRDAGLLELGAILLDQRRFGDPTGGTLVRRRTDELADLDAELVAIEQVIDADAPSERVAELQQLRCLTCSSLLGPADRFCVSCGAPRPADDR